MAYDIPGWEENAPYTEYDSGEENLSDTVIFWYQLVFDNALSADRLLSKIRLRIGATGGTVKVALYSRTFSADPNGRPGTMLWESGELTATANSYLEATISPAYQFSGSVVWVGVKPDPDDTTPSFPYKTTDPSGNETAHKFSSPYDYDDPWPTSPTVSGTRYGYLAVYVDELIVNDIDDTAHGAESISIRVSLSRSDTAGTVETVNDLAAYVYGYDTGTGTDSTSLASQLAHVLESALGADALGLSFSAIQILDAAAAADLVLKSGTGNFISDLAHGTDSVTIRVTLALADVIAASESFRAPLITVHDTGGVSTIPGQEGEVVVAPIIVITDTAAGADTVIIVMGITDTAAGADSIVVVQGTINVADTAEGVDTILITGQTLPEPPPATVGSLEAKHVLKLILGDPRDPERTLDLAQEGDGNITLARTNHRLGAGEPNILWSGTSYRFDGERKVAESRGNSRLVLKYNLAAGSGAAMSALQRSINRFFVDARRYQEDGEGLPVYLVYRWSDALGNLPTPVFGQLDYYWEIYQANVPEWPDNLHDGGVVGGFIEGVSLEVVGSPYPQGMEQLAGFAYGAVEDTHGVRLNSGTSGFLQWSYDYAFLEGQYTIAGWFTPYWTEISDDRTIFSVMQGNNQLKLVYEGANDYFRITKIVGGATYTATSAVFSISPGDHVHVALVDNGTLRLYVNGGEAASVAVEKFTFTVNVTIRLGTNITGPDGIDVALDGWRMFGDDLTETQIVTLYNAELAVKNLDETIGPPICYTAYSSEESLFLPTQEYLTVMGVSGDVEAKIRLQAQPSSGSYGVWAGRKATREAISSNVWRVDWNGISYSTVAPYNGQRYSGLTIASPNWEQIEGRYACLLFARTTVVGSSVTVKPGITFSNNINQPGIIGDGVTISYNSGLWKLYELGEIYIRPKERSAATSAIIFLEFSNATGTPSLDLDFMMLLSWPYMGLKKTAYEVSVIYTLNEQPFGRSSAGIVSYPEVVGTPLTLVPGQYNHVFFVPHVGSVAFSPLNDSLFPNLYVTPRFLLPGGMIA